MRMAWMMETRRRVVMFVWRAQKEVEAEDARSHAAEEMFSLHAPNGDARSFIVGDVGGDSCRNIVKRAARRHRRPRDVRERCCKSCLYEMSFSSASG